jgi:exodeoxyribonuclease VII large subunit
VLCRYSWLELLVYHVPVQGEGSAELIAEGLRLLNHHSTTIGGVDVILLARGGGSLEDLWEFNEEILARAIAASKIPIITGIGHEVDVSVADLVADYHAHTPTEAAQVVTTRWKLVKDQLDIAGARLLRGLRTVAHDSRQRLTGILRHEFFRRPTDRINQLRQFLDDRQRSLLLAIGGGIRDASTRLARTEATLVKFHPRHLVDLKRQKLADLSRRMDVSIRTDLQARVQRIVALERHLNAVSPQAVLNRGYSITTRKKTGAIIRSARETRVGERLATQFADGTVESTVEDKNQLPLFE